MASKNKNVKSYFQKKFPLYGIILFMLCMCIFQSVLPSSYELISTVPTTTNSGTITSMTLKVLATSPQDGAILKNFPVNLEVQVIRGNIPVQGVRVQFWMMGGSHDMGMHNAFLTTTDSSGYARLTVLNQNTLDQGTYIWYADATLPGFKGGASKVISFTNPFASTTGILTSGGTVSTDQTEYSLEQGNGATVVIHGNINNYHSGQPIILKIKSPSGKTVQIVGYGSYLGTFQMSYKLGQNSELGQYSVTVTHNYFVSTTCGFQIVK